MPNTFDPIKLASFIEEAGLSYKTTSKSFIFDCPLCQSKDRLYIRKTDGRFICWKCATSRRFQGAPEFALEALTGTSLKRIREALYGDKHYQASLALDIVLDAFDDELGPLDDELEGYRDIPSVEWPYHCLPLWAKGAENGVRYMELRGVPYDIACNYHIHYSPEKRSVVFPIEIGKKLVGYQYRTIDSTSVTKPDGTPVELLKTISSLDIPRDRCMMFSNRLTSDFAVLCEGPIDALKCFGKNTRVLLFDGSVKNIQDIAVGDLLMGPDSNSRKVIGIGEGFGKLFLVKPREGGGDPWVCNEEHTLFLKSRPGFPIKEKVLISVRDFNQKSRNFHLGHGLFRATLDFQEKTLPVPPYILGLWLGDGDTGRAGLDTMDKEIEKEWSDWVTNNGDYLEVIQKPRKKSSHFLARPFIQWGRNPRVFIKNNTGGWENDGTIRCISKKKLNDLGVIGNKRIPLAYLFSSKEQRLELLAGLLDTDGTLAKKTSFAISQSIKREGLMNDLVFLARSLGLRVCVHRFMARFNKNTVRTPQIRANISGGIDQIPTKLPRKKAVGKGKESSTITGFDISPLQEGDFYGVETDGDHLFLLEDLTVVHNCHLLGSGNVASMGKKVSHKQIELLLRSGIKKLYLALDPDAAEEINPILRQIGGVEAYLVELPCKGPKDKVDLGSLSMEEARDCILAAKPMPNNRIHVWLDG